MSKILKLNANESSAHWELPNSREQIEIYSQLMRLELTEPFLSAYEKVKKLQLENRYLGSLIFGSVARRQQDKNSDLDVMVVVDSNNECKQINHPIINNIKLDITFRSLKQIEEMNDELVKKGEIVPILTEAVIVFDKTGQLTKLKNKFIKVQPKKVTPLDYQFIQFMIYHADNKAKRNLKDDKTTALLAMGININEIIKYHYQINGKWWVSNKRLLPDLRTWDGEMARLLEKFVLTSQVNRKYRLWSQILDHVAKPIGGRKPISEINCECAVCRADLAALNS